MNTTPIQSAGFVRVTAKELTSRSLRPFYKSASVLAESGVRELVIDLSDVTYMDSASLGCLMDICRVMSEHNGVVKLVGLQERVQTLALMAGLTRYIGVPGEDGIYLRNLEPFAAVRKKGIWP